MIERGSCQTVWGSRGVQHVLASFFQRYTSSIHLSRGVRRSSSNEPFSARHGIWNELYFCQIDPGVEDTGPVVGS